MTAEQFRVLCSGTCDTGHICSQPVRINLLVGANCQADVSDSLIVMHQRVVKRPQTQGGLGGKETRSDAARASKESSLCCTRSFDSSGDFGCG